MGDPALVFWTGELLWPVELPTAAVVDLAGVTALGVWCHDWFRRHPGQMVSGALAWKERLLRAGVPVHWHDGSSSIVDHAGVSADEREMLWG